MWLYTLLLPSFAKSGWLPIMFLSEGMFGIDLLRPQQLFGLTGLDEITHCLFWSLLANIGCYVGVSLAATARRRRAQPGDAVRRCAQAASAAGSRFWRGSASVQELSDLLGRFLGPERAQRSARALTPRHAG